MVTLGLRVGIGSGKVLPSSGANDSLPLGRRDGEVKGSGESVSPRREEDVGGPATGAGHVIGPLGEQKARPFELSVGYCTRGNNKDLVAGLVVSPGAVPSGTKNPRMVSPGVEDLIA